MILLPTQELERRERERQRHEEQRSFAALQAQYGMAERDKGDFEAQSISGMQRAVFNGEMSVGDYYERQVGIGESDCRKCCRVRRPLSNVETGA